MSRSFQSVLKFVLATATTLMLVACGGGGGSAGTPILGTGGTSGSGSGSSTTSSSPSTLLAISLVVGGGTTSSVGIASGQSTVLVATVTNALTGAVVANQAVSFEFSSNISNANLSATTANTSATGQAATLYTAGNQSSGTDIVTATVTDSSGKVATASVQLAVQATTSNYTMTVTPNGQLTVGPNTAAPGTTMQTVDQGIPFTVSVKDSNGNAVPNLTVTSALGSANSATYIATTGVGGAVTGTVAVVPGFLTQSATVASTLTNTTDANGLAKPTYISGGKAGTDIVIFTVTRSGIIIASQSVTVVVN